MSYPRDDFEPDQKDKPQFKKVKRSIMIDPILWHRFTKKCFDNEVKYSNQVATLIQKYLLEESGKTDS